VVDEERVTRLLSRTTEDLDFLASFRSRPRAELLGDPQALAAIKYGFIVAIEGCTRVAHHLAVSEGWGAPDTNADALRLLAETIDTEGELDGRALVAAAGFRNLLVHQYADIDDGRVVDALDRLDDLRSLVSNVAAWIDEQQSS
jgi:uncharacterized protein YutE (UPF0331/DUF86 family)